MTQNARLIRVVDELRQDLRYALRTLRRNPGFAAVAIVTLALGIGANTAIYSVVNAVLVRPLPYEDPDSLAVVWEKHLKRGTTQLVSYYNFFHWRAENHVFANMAAYSGGQFTINQSGSKEVVYGMTVSGTFFPALGVKAAMGRTLVETDEKGAETPVVLSHQFWSERFGSDRNILGRRLEFNDKSCTVVGILPHDFRLVLPGLSRPEIGFPRPQVWVPIASDEELRNARGNWLRVVARTKPGISLVRAGGEMDGLAARLAQENRRPAGVVYSGVAVMPLREQIVGDVRASLLLLLGAVGFVLLIACANAANLFFARALGRGKEFALRAAVGAGPLRLLRQQLTESGLLALIAGISSLLALRWGVDLIVAFCPRMIPRIDEISVDCRVLLFALGLSLLTGILFGLFPALRASRLDLDLIVKQAPGDSGRPRGGYRDLLLMCEISLALVLAAGAMLLMKSFVRLTNVDPGFKRENVLICTVSLQQQGSTAGALEKEIVNRIEALPRVAAAGVAGTLPLVGTAGSSSFRVNYVMGQSRPDLGENLEVDDMRVSPGYFRAMGLQFLQGRTFSSAAAETQPELIVSESLARKLWPGEDAVGKRLHLGSQALPWIPIVGVARDVRQHGLDQEARLTLYRPYRGGGYFSLVVQTRSDPTALVRDVRGRILSVDKTALILQPRSVEEILSDSVAQPRFYTTLFALFASLAIALAAIGIYGVASYSVSCRIRELGIRIALGARPAAVIRTVLAREMAMAFVGVAFGILLSLALTRFLTGLLFGVAPNDPLTLIPVALGMTFVSLLAGYVPARRATQVDPMAVLKEL